MGRGIDPRHQRRREIVQNLFAQSFTRQDSFPEVEDVLANRSKIDTMIEASAPSWPIDKINRIDLSILRYAIWEIGEGITPPKVVIDEAVELAKEFGSETSPGFVNGVLGTVFQSLVPNYGK